MKNMPGKKTVVSLALGSAFAVALGAAPIASAGENPFAAQSVTKGFMLADANGDRGYGDRGYGKSGEGRCGMSMADTDNDGRVSADEHARHCQVMFEKMDTNKDGFIDKDEAAKMRKMHGHGPRGGYGSRERSGYSSSDQSSQSGYAKESMSGYGEYGTRTGDRELQHMKPMGR
jgi:EF hand